MHPLTTIEPIVFPRDDGAHRTLNEWWYYTGHLRADDGARYGFELVVFQVLLGNGPPLYRAHFAVTDHRRRSFAFDYRSRRGEQAVAPRGHRFDVNGWTMRGIDGSDSLSAFMDGYALELTTRSLKSPVAHNHDGYVTFGSAGGSYYYSRTRLEVTGTVVDHGDARRVHGEAWFDHQWGNFRTPAMGGWDWYGVQLEDGSDLMVSVVRGQDGVPPLTYGTYVDARGEATHIPAPALDIVSTGTWTSPRSGARYPMGWRIAVQVPRLDLTLTPILADQELNTGRGGTTYWEGEVSVTSNGGGSTSGSGYVELTGYARGDPARWYARGAQSTNVRRLARTLSWADSLSRRRDWQGKVMDLALFTGFALAISPRDIDARLFNACLILAATVALAVFGYAWNDACDADADARAGKLRPPRRHSGSVAVAALGASATLLVSAARLDASLLALACAVVALPWAYSGLPLRLKERRVLGLLAGSIAQRALPAVFIATAFDVPVRYAVPWLAWMTCWGVRGMIVHQVDDAAADRLAGLTTWGGTSECVRLEARRLVTLLVPLEVVCFIVAIAPLLSDASVRIAAIVVFAGWTLLKVARFPDVHARPVPIDWLSFRAMPLGDVYGVCAPLLVAAALARTDTSVAWAWILLDAAVRLPALHRTSRTIVTLISGALVREPAPG